MALWKMVVALMLIGYLTAGLAGCGQDNPAERTGKALEDIVGDAKKAGKNITNSAGDTAKGELERVKKKLNEGATQQ